MPARSGETIPICDNCPMADKTFLPGQYTQEQLRSARAEAYDVAYNQVGDFSDIADTLAEERGVDPEVARFAMECVGHMMRRYCMTADRGWLETDPPQVGVVARSDRWQ